MSKVITDVAVGAALIAADFALPGMGIALSASMSSMLASAGTGFVLQGIGTLLSQRANGVHTTSRNPLQPWQIVYGRTKVGGTIVYQEEVASNNRILLLVVAVAAHPCQQVEQIWFNNKKLQMRLNGQFADASNPNGFWQSFTPPQGIWNIETISRTNDVVSVTFEQTDKGIYSGYNGETIWIRGTIDSQGGDSLNGYFPVVQTGPSSFTYTCGGPQGAGQANTGTLKSTWPDYGTTVTAGYYLGNQTEASGIILGNTAGYWTEDCILKGRTYVALKLEYDSSIYNGLPEISFVVQGKNDIYDCRTNTYGYTDNAALCIADYLHNPIWGFNASYGSQIPTDALISAANICNEKVPLALGGTESRYCCDGSFDVSVKRGDVLQNLLTSCAGRLVYSGGQFIINPAAWVPPSASITIGDGSTGPNMLLNSDGLVVNSYNNPTGGGRQGYFPDSAGTSESQFLFTLGMLNAYQATGNVEALSLAKLTLSPMEEVLYRNYPVPQTVTDTAIYPPHWLFNVKQPFTSAVVRYEDEFTFTNGVATVPDTYGTVRYVFQAMTPGYQLIYTSPYSPPKSGTAYPVASYQYVQGQGTVVTLQDTSFNGTLCVIYSCLSGPAILTGQDFEAYPDWRPLAQGEIDSACDTYNWAMRCFDAAATVIDQVSTSSAPVVSSGYGRSPYGVSYGDPVVESPTTNSQYLAMLNATKQQAAVVYKVNNQRQWISRSVQLQPFSQSGSFTFSDIENPPAITCDAAGDIVLTFNADSTSGTVTQFGVASINDTYNAGDYTVLSFKGDTQGSVYEIQLYIDTQNQQPTFNADNRYTFSLTVNSGWRYDLTLHNTDFVNDKGQALPIGSPVYTCGVQLPGLGLPAGDSVTIYGVRQYPDLQVKYEGGAIPFTANFLGNPASLIGWQGPCYAGYQSPWAIKQLGNETNVSTNVQFLADSQAAWTAQSATKDVGPFCPVFYFVKPDAVQYGPANTWGWNGPDPNTVWCGYQYRPLAELGELIAACNGSEPYYAQAVTVTNNFLAWLDANWTNATAGPPTLFPQTGAQTTYQEPHAAALILRAVLLMDQVQRPNGTGTMNASYQSLLNKVYAFWQALYVTSGVMAGTFCTDPTGALDWYGFWHGEILRTLSLLVTWTQKTNNSAMKQQAITWIDGMVNFAMLNIVDVGGDIGYTVKDLRGGITWRPKLPKHQLYNGIKGTYISEANQWQQSDFPSYAQDQLHGYTDGSPAYQYDANSQADGGRLWKDIQLPFTTSVSAAQRIAKIELMRIRQQGRGALQGMMTMYGSAPLDTVYLSYKPFAWENKIVEVANTRLTFEKVQSDQSNGQEVTLLGTEMDIQETDSSVYDWSVTEELSVQGYSYIPNLSNLSPEA